MKTPIKITAFLTAFLVTTAFSNSYAETFVKGKFSNNQVLISVGEHEKHPNQAQRKIERKVEVRNVHNRDYRDHRDHRPLIVRPAIVTHQVVNYYPRRHAAFGVHISFLPTGFKPVWAGAQYYYLDGDYYMRSNFGYTVVAPPIGAIVSNLPYDYQPVVVNGIVYYTSNGAYYTSTPQGYLVVSKPVTTMFIAEPSNQNVIVNVPNSNGGYSAVTLQKSSNGFIGPQGEFYPEFPPMTQLQAMYTN